MRALQVGYVDPVAAVSSSAAAFFFIMIHKTCRGCPYRVGGSPLAMGQKGETTPIGASINRGPGDSIAAVYAARKSSSVSTLVAWTP